MLNYYLPYESYHVVCPECESGKVRYTIPIDGDTDNSYYICKDCHYEFKLEFCEC